MVPLPEPPKSLTMEMAAAQRAAPNQCRRYRSDLAHRPSFDAVADGAQEDRDAAAAAEREEKRRLELQRQQDEQQAQEQELQQLQVAPSMSPVASELPHTCQAIIDALQAKLDRKARDADTSACSCSANSECSAGFL